MLVRLVLLLAFATPSFAAAEKSCLAEVGKVRAQAYVDMCAFFSGATHPPCNVLNACSMMQEEIDSNCTDKKKCVVPTVDGTWKCSDDKCSDFSFVPKAVAKAKPQR